MLYIALFVGATTIGLWIMGFFGLILGLETGDKQTQRDGLIMMVSGVVFFIAVTVVKNLVT